MRLLHRCWVGLLVAAWLLAACGAEPEAEIEPAVEDATDAAMDSAWPAHVEGHAPDPAEVQVHTEDLRADGAAVLGLGDHLEDRFA